MQKNKFVREKYDLSGFSVYLRNGLVICRTLCAWQMMPLVCCEKGRLYR